MENFLNLDGTPNVSKIVKAIRQTHKEINDSFYNDFDQLPDDHRLTLTHALRSLKQLANNIQLSEDLFYDKGDFFYEKNLY